MWRVGDVKGKCGVTVSTFTRGRFGISVMDGAFSVCRNVLGGDYQDNLHSVCHALLRSAVGFA